MFKKRVLFLLLLAGLGLFLPSCQKEEKKVSYELRDVRADGKGYFSTFTSMPEGKELSNEQLSCWKQQANREKVLQSRTSFWGVEIAYTKILQIQYEEDHHDLYAWGTFECF